LRSFLAALGFLTLFPVPRSIHEDARDLGRAVWWFPLVGLLLGFAAAFLDRACGAAFPDPLRAALTVLSLLVLTRGLHMDGLADAADGLLSFRSREKILEIMRDPRSGPMAVMAVTGVMVLKMAAVYSLPESWRWKTLLMAPVAGRCVMGLVMGLGSYARSEGLAAPFQGGAGPAKAAWCGLFLLAAASLALGMAGFFLAGAGLLAAYGLGAWTRDKIGGFTGDTLGAACELAETLWLVLLFPMKELF
jgi:adenosylcobinamide-GDP ribazoletransferase